MPSSLWKAQQIIYVLELFLQCLAVFYIIAQMINNTHKQGGQKNFFRNSYSHSIQLLKLFLLLLLMKLNCQTSSIYVNVRMIRNGIILSKKFRKWSLKRFRMKRSHHILHVAYFYSRLVAHVLKKRIRVMLCLCQFQLQAALFYKSLQQFTIQRLGTPQILIIVWWRLFVGHLCIVVDITSSQQLIIRVR